MSATETIHVRIWHSALHPRGAGWYWNGSTVEDGARGEGCVQHGPHEDKFTAATDARAVARHAGAKINVKLTNRG